MTPRRLRKADLPRDALGRLRPPGAPDELAHLRNLDEQLSSTDEALERAAALFDQQRFFEAFRHLSWPLKGDEHGGDHHWWKGLAQVAAGLCHLQRDNAVGAERLLERSLGYLEPYPDDHPGVSLPALRRDVRGVLDQLRRGVGPHDVNLPRWPGSPEAG